jgi:hypothetical protein
MLQLEIQLQTLGTTPFGHSEAPFKGDMLHGLVENALSRHSPNMWASLKQALPLPGFDKSNEQLDGKFKHTPIVLLALRKTIRLALLFLAGLALRNLFKLK